MTHLLFLKTLLARLERILSIFLTMAFFKNLAQPTALDGSETFKIIRTYQEIDFFLNGHFYTVSE